MNKIISFFISSYYYLNSSYKIWRIRSCQIDDLVYTTAKGVEFQVYPGSKQQSPYDFIVKYKEPGKRERTPAHVHLIVEMYVKYAFDPNLTLQLKEHILQMLSQIKPVSAFPPVLQFYKPEHCEPFRALDNIGEFSIEFLLVAIELVAIQEKTNYPNGTVTVNLYKNFGVKDRFSVIQSAVWKGGK